MKAYVLKNKKTNCYAEWIEQAECSSRIENFSFIIWKIFFPINKENQNVSRIWFAKTLEDVVEVLNKPSDYSIESCFDFPYHDFKENDVEIVEIEIK